MNAIANWRAKNPVAKLQHDAFNKKGGENLQKILQLNRQKNEHRKYMTRKQLIGLIIIFLIVATIALIILWKEKVFDDPIANFAVINRKEMEKNSIYKALVQ